MKCLKCGHELQENASFCNQCGEPVLRVEPEQDNSVETENVNEPQKIIKKQWNDKYTILVIIAVFVIAIIAGLIFKSVKNKPDDYSTEDAGAEEYIYEEEDDSEDIVSSEGEGTNNYLNVNVEEEVLNIRGKYDEIVENISDGLYYEYSLQDGVTAYCDDSDLHAIVVSKNVNQNPYQRSYYYNNNELMFAYYENDDAHRLYFYEEQLMRWRYSEDAAKAQDAVNYDLETAGEYLEWESLVLQESDEFRQKIDAINAVPFSMSYIEEILASSMLSENNTVHSPERLVDDNLSAAWVEGVSGQGTEETVYFYFDDTYLVHGIDIAAGYQKSNELYEKNSRPSEIKVVFSDGTYEIHELNDVNDFQNITFDKARITDSIFITIEDVYPGTKYKDTVISEIHIY